MMNEFGEFEEHRGMMFGIAYRMMGSAMEAEDIVQEAFLRYESTDKAKIKSHKAFLSTIVTRLCIDQLKSAKSQRETYIGPWLPEPVITSNNPDWLNPVQHMNTLESISMAFLVLLESLTPIERAVFLLREVFDYEYHEIAQIVDKSEVACRQYFSRAKKHITDNRPRFQTSPEEHKRILGQFITTIESGDLKGLTSILAEDVTLWSDGGGKVTAATRPIHGYDSVAKFLFGITRLGPEGFGVEIKEVNGKPAIVIHDGGDKTLFVMNIDIVEGVIIAIRAIGNPDKLKAL